MRNEKTKMIVYVQQNYIRYIECEVIIKVQGPWHESAATLRYMFIYLHTHIDSQNLYTILITVKVMIPL